MGEDSTEKAPPLPEESVKGAAPLRAAKKEEEQSVGEIPSDWRKVSDEELEAPPGWKAIPDEELQQDS